MTQKAKKAAPRKRAAPRKKAAAMELRPVPLEQLRRWDKNPKPHDIGRLIQSFQRYGFLDPPAFDCHLNDGKGGIKEGNGRYEALSMMRANGDPSPRNIVEANGDWLVPVLFGVDAKSEAEAEAYALDHNALTVLGGDFGADWITNLYGEDGLKDVLLDLGKLDELPVSIDGDDLDALLNKGVFAPVGVDEQGSLDELNTTCPECGHVFAR